MGIDVGTPLSLPTTTAAGLHPGVPAVDVHGFTPQTIQSHQFHDFNPFTSHNAFTPDQFTKQPSGFEPMDASADGPAIQNIAMDTDMQEEDSSISFHPRHFDANVTALPPNHLEK